MTEPREVELWLCGYIAKCSAPECRQRATKSCAISTTRGDPIIRQTLSTPTRASCALS
jgi:hypothetical protein